MTSGTETVKIGPSKSFVLMGLFLESLGRLFTDSNFRRVTWEISFNEHFTRGMIIFTDCTTNLNKLYLVNLEPLINGFDT